MRILILSQYWPPQEGVPQRRWSWLTSLLKEQGHEIQVIAPSSPKYEDNDAEQRIKWTHRLARPARPISGVNGESIFRTRCLRSSSSLTFRAANQALVALDTTRILIGFMRRERSAQPNVVIGTVPALPTALTTFLASILLRAPYIIDLRDAWPDLLSNPKIWNQGLKKQSLRERLLLLGPAQAVTWGLTKLLSIVYRRSDGMIFTSSRLEHQMRTKLLPDSTISTVIRNTFPRSGSVSNYAPSNKHLEPSASVLNVVYAGKLGLSLIHI